MKSETVSPEKKHDYVRKSKEIMQRIMSEKNLSSDDVKKAMEISEDEQEY